MRVCTRPITADSGGISQTATLQRSHENLRCETASLLSGGNNGKVSQRVVTPQTFCLDGRETTEQPGSQSTVDHFKAKNPLSSM